MGKHSGERPRAEGRRASATLLGRASGWQGLGKAQAAGIRQPGPGGLPALPRPGHPAVAPIQPVFTETRTSRAPMTGLTGSSSSRCRQREAESRRRSRANGTFGRRQRGRGACVRCPTSPAQPCQPFGRARSRGRRARACGPQSSRPTGVPAHMKPVAWAAG